jgi:mono/diheme cytochrome c family protein
MRRAGSVEVALFAVVAAMAALASCAQEQYPASLWAAQHPATSGGATSPSADASLASPTPGPLDCTQSHADPIPARLVAMSANASSGGTIVLASSIFQQFVEICGSCHGPAVDPPGQGGFQIAQAAEFASLMTSSVLNHVTHSVCPMGEDPTNPYDPMPPCSSPQGQTFSTRPSTDPVKQFADLVGQWIMAGSPAEFTMNSGNASGPSSLVMSPVIGNSMTNLGNCIPSAALLSLATQNAKAKALDAMFAGLQSQPGGTAAQAIGLPENLADTDLFTFDSSVLAQYGVIAYVPAYPLWSDNAYKLRYVRVPIGTSIRFDKATQTFQIPPNTRFYKTFTKKISDTDGSYRYRKIETRLIVSRPDINNADGSATQTALFGTYRWSDDESQATLVETPLNDGQPFADTLLLYNTDEQLAAQVLAEQPLEPEIQLVAAGAARHYAIPSSQRCMQCHMGSPAQAFVLGFTPLQINQMPTGTHGVIPEFDGSFAGPDALSQLQRLMDAGIVTGIESVSDVLPLEESQGSRKPRGSGMAGSTVYDNELKAQGYMLGNCAHCHNPRGFPSVQNPVLKDIFNLLPSTGASGGIFQFPLERYSPRIGRGVTGSTLIPYITPSLVDLPKMDPENPGTQKEDWFINAYNGQVVWVDFAPWRSILYRNVDGPFAYTDDVAIFPHMPFNTPGYDPRAKQIMSDWMVSIPARRKHPEIPEYAYQTDSFPADNINGPVVDTTEQPYVEVLPGTPDYNQAVMEAETRLQILHTGQNMAIPWAPAATGNQTECACSTTYSRYLDPNGITPGIELEDILDPDVLQNPICEPVPSNPNRLDTNPLPLHPHWVNTDLTSPPGPYQPRQTNWINVLVEQMLPAPPAPTGCTAPSAQLAAYNDQLVAIKALPGVALDQVQPYVTTPIPFGLWQQQAGCTFPSSVAPAASSFTGTSRPHWMDVANPAADAPVYMETPGAAVFKMICINCHGPDAAADGRMAQNLATMTGGNALVADFRDGMFGPPGVPESMSNRAMVFGTAELPMASSDLLQPWLTAPDGSMLTDDDRASRYMAWMGLGGTAVNIPVELLEIVAVTKVFDQNRTIAATNLSANMLSEAKSLCLSLLGPTSESSQTFPIAAINGGQGYLASSTLNTILIKSNGDAELWMRLCSLANRPPVHVFSAETNGVLSVNLGVPSIGDGSGNLLVQSGAMVPSSVYPTGVPIGNDQGTVDTLGYGTADDQPNLWPWCVSQAGATPAQVAWFQSNNLPICPQAVDDNLAHCSTNPTQYGPCFWTDEGNAWAVRGAINAGLAVFEYVKSMEDSGPAPDYNQCSLLN